MPGVNKYGKKRKVVKEKNRVQDMLKISPWFNRSNYEIKSLLRNL